MAVNSRKKGNKAERLAAEHFTKWTGYKFSRTPSSGGLHWKKQNTIGDIVCTEEGKFFPFCVEVKNHKEINFSHLIYLETAKILEFWKQCTTDSSRGNKIPLLMMRYSGMPKTYFFCMMYKKHWDLIEGLVNKKEGKYFFIHGLEPTPTVILSYQTLFNTAYLPIKKVLKAYIKNGH